jgi:phosphoserine phosphatase
VAAAIGDPPVDINVVAGVGPARRKRLLCADMESTIIEQELIDEIACLVGCHAEISAITAAAMRGELDFEGSLVRRVALFAGLEVQRLGPILDRVTLMPGAEALIRTMRADGATTALITGGFTLFAERIAERLGFDVLVGNVLDIEDGRLTGRVRDPIVGPQGKADALRRLATEGGITLADTLAVGDGANDVGMLAAAGLGVAFRAKPILADRALASEQGAVVVHGDLTALLYLQGYGQAEIDA